MVPDMTRGMGACCLSLVPGQWLGIDGTAFLSINHNNHHNTSANSIFPGQQMHTLSRRSATRQRGAPVHPTFLTFRIVQYAAAYLEQVPLANRHDSRQ